MSVRLTVSSASRALVIPSRVGTLGESRPPSSRAMADWVVPTSSASWRWLRNFFSRSALISKARRMQ